jgi:hypothetical protein
MGVYSQRVVVTSAARTTTGNSGALTVGGDTNFGSPEWVVLAVDVTAASGTTPTLDLTVQWSLDGGTTWATTDGTPDAFAQITAAATRVKRFPALSGTYRVVWTIAGTTPSFTFSVREQAINE